MSTPAEYFIDRRRLRRKLGWWRLAALVALGIAGLVAMVRLGGVDSADKLTPHIARFELKGMITGDDDTVEMIRKIGDSTHAKALLLEIESPGGTTAGSERLYDELRRVAEKKPVVAVVGTVAASGAYIAAIAADTIVARGNSLVGSIGVLFQYPNVSKLLNNWGVDIETIKSSPLKAAPNGLEPTSPAAREAVASLVADSYAWFKGLVQQRRNLDDAQLANVSDGRIFTARQGVPLKLVDLIGGQHEAIDWLVANKGVAKDLPVREWKKKSSLERLGLIEGAAGIARVAGLASIADFLEKTIVLERTSELDGLLAIWQHSAAN